MSLSEYLIESVAKRESGKYAVKFPLNPDKESVVDFLETHGFREVKYNDMSKKSGRVYCFGKCNNDPATHWIRFIDNSGERTMYFCRVKYAGICGGIDFDIIKRDSRIDIGNDYQRFAQHVEEEFC